LQNSPRKVELIKLKRTLERHCYNNDLGGCQKNILKESVFVNSALKLQCHIVENTLLQTVFSAILPTRMFYPIDVVTTPKQTPYI